MNILKPTLHFRWADASMEDEKGPVVSPARYWPECGASYYKLQQWCEDEQGNGEWIDIPCQCDAVNKA